MEEIKDLISTMSDRELLETLQSKYTDYTSDALKIAVEEAERRGLSFSRERLEKYISLSGSEAEFGGDLMTCQKCQGEMVEGKLFVLSSVHSYADAGLYFSAQTENGEVKEKLIDYKGKIDASVCTLCHIVTFKV